MNGAGNALAEVRVLLTPNDPRAAIARLHQEQYVPLVRTVAVIIGDVAETEDIVQEAYLRLFRSWPHVRDPEKAPAYLRTTVFNLARSRFRALARAERRESATKHEVGPEERALATDASSSVIAALKVLPTRQRECLVLRYYLDLTDRQIAETLRISIGAVKRHVHRALEKLESSLEGYR